MIVSFGDTETELIYYKERSIRILIAIQASALIKFIFLNSAETKRDLQLPPSDRFERLKGNRNGFYSILGDGNYIAKVRLGRIRQVTVQRDWGFSDVRGSYGDLPETALGYDNGIVYGATNTWLG